MATLKIYGGPMSRTFRNLWLAEELGLDYDNVPIGFAEDSKTPEYLALNPNGKIPVISDNGTLLFESMAINLYLCKKYGAVLWPDTVADEGRLYQWTFWVVTEVEGLLLDALLYKLGEGGYEQSDEESLAAFAALDGQMQILDRALSNQPYLAGDGFGIADLNVAAVMSWAHLGQMDLSRWPALADWLGRCLSRPACAKFMT